MPTAIIDRLVAAGAGSQISVGAPGTPGIDAARAPANVAVPRRVRTLLDKAGIVPAAPGTKLELDAVDEKMTAASFTTEERIMVKQVLADVGQLTLGRPLR
jgi:hypothetical protein